jgi:hypothetical protein
MFNPARVRKNLRQFKLGLRVNTPVLIKNNASGTGSALVERE